MVRKCAVCQYVVCYKFHIDYNAKYRVPFMFAQAESYLLKAANGTLISN